MAWTGVCGLLFASHALTCCTCLNSICVWLIEVRWDHVSKAIRPKLSCHEMLATALPPMCSASLHSGNNLGCLQYLVKTSYVCLALLLCQPWLGLLSDRLYLTLSPEQIWCFRWFCVWAVCSGLRKWHRPSAMAPCQPTASSALMTFWT